MDVTGNQIAALVLRRSLAHGVDGCVACRLARAAGVDHYLASGSAVRYPLCAPKNSALQCTRVEL